MSHREITYFIDNNGCFICISHKCRNKNGYPTIMIDGKRNISIHRLVLEQKLGRPIKLGLCALHNCNNSRCINPDHIYEGTQKDNVNDQIKNGTRPNTNGIKNGRHKLTDLQVIKIRKLAKRGLSTRKLGRQFGINSGTICNIINKKLWKHIAEEELS